MVKKSILEGGHLRRWLLACGGFLLLSTPSVKLFYSSELVNVMALVLLVLGGSCSARISSAPPRTLLLVLWAIFAILIWLFLLRSAYNYALLDIVKYGYLVAAVFLLVLCVDRSIVTLVTRLLLLWACWLALWHLTIGIPTNPELGQHYLSVGLPIAVGLAISMIGAFIERGSGRERMGYLLAAVLCLAAIVTLPGRSTLINPMIVFITSGVFVGLLDRGRTARMRTMVAASIGAALLGSLALYSHIDFAQSQRFDRLLNRMAEEPRLILYRDAIEHIVESPIIGYGTNAPRAEFGHYPHNLFLDILLQGGVVLLIPFLAIFVLYGRAFLKCARNGSGERGLLGFLGASGVLFLQWNTSFDLTTSYIPIGAMAMLIVAASSMSDCRLRDGILMRPVNTTARVL